VWIKKLEETKMGTLKIGLPHLRKYQPNPDSDLKRTGKQAIILDSNGSEFS
jgi:hypothetical protein